MMAMTTSNSIRVKAVDRRRVRFLKTSMEAKEPGRVGEAPEQAANVSRGARCASLRTEGNLAGAGYRMSVAGLLAERFVEWGETLSSRSGDRRLSISEQRTASTGS